MSTINHKKLSALCKRCSSWHPLEYQIQKNKTIHLVYRCINRKNKKFAAEFLPFENNLPIPSYFTHNINQLNLFGADV